MSRGVISVHSDRGVGKNNDPCEDLEGTMIKPVGEMQSAVKRYYNINKFLVSKLGGWPSQSKFMKILLPTIITSFIFSIGFLEVTTRANSVTSRKKTRIVEKSIVARNFIQPLLTTIIVNWILYISCDFIHVSN